jgi:3-methylcrotonyl-CoA carboxylase alpha subunit
MTARELHWRIAGQDVAVHLEESKDHGILHISGRSIPFRTLGPNWIEIDGGRRRFYVLRDRNKVTVWFNGHTYELEKIEKGLQAVAAVAGASGEVVALMPGKILRVEVKSGDVVVEKQTVILMESMKMETALRAPKAGRVAEVRCEAGQVVDMGERLVVIE